ncbi:MAG: NB-ARC domain-containing protein, partial [Synechocystis sp.]
MSGVGKTELTIQYGILHWQDYLGGICWVNSRDSDVQKQIVDFATNELKLRSDHIGNLDQRVLYCWNNWPREGNVLVIFDDVTSYKQIESYLPPQLQPRFRVLITTRRILGQSMKRIELDILSPNDAIELLKSLIGNERVEHELEVAKRLCESLGYLPLGFELVGKYINLHQAVTIKKVLNQLQENLLRHPATTNATDEMTAPRGLEVAFDLSWNELNGNAKQLGCLLSLFDSTVISLPLVEKAINESNSTPNERTCTALVSLGEDFAWGPEQSKAVSDLAGLNLIKHVSNGNYRLHELIREFFRGKLTPNGLSHSECLKREFSRGMLLVAQQTFESSNFSMPEIKALFDFLLQVPTRGRNEGTLLKFLELLFQCHSIQQYIYDTGYLESAIEKLERAKEYLRQLEESKNLKAQVTSLKLIGHAYYSNPAENREQAINNMMAAQALAARAAQENTPSSEPQIWLWYQVFLLDHVHNLLTKPSDQPSTLVPSDLEDQIAQLLPTSLEQADTSPELDVLPSLLRAAHYWGHRGNQVTFKLENLLRELPSTRSEEVETLLEDGINYYSLASIFRAANFRLSFPQQYQQHLANILDEIPNIPQWLLTWNPPANSLDFERFTSASQAVGDIAHQYRGMATIQLFGCFYNVSRGLSSSLLEEASSVVDVAAGLWEQAKILLTPGEQVIKYYAWMTNLEMMLQLLMQYSSDTQLPSQADVEREVTAKLDVLESEYGLVYGWARNQTIRQIDQFHNMLSRLNRS